MNYTIDHERFDPFNFNRYVAEIVAELPSGLVKVLAFLSGHISYSSDHEMFPKGMVSGLSAPKIAERIGMGLSTVRSHLADAKRRNIIATLTLEDRHGRTVGVRYFFPGFSDWLHDGGFMSRRGDEPPLQEAGEGGANISDPNKITDSSNKIIHDGKLNLEFEGSITHTEVADAIREAKPLVNGQAADPNKVWSDFCSFNKKKGKRWLPLKWLVGFCRVYGRKKFASNTQQQPQIQPNTTDQANEVPAMEHPEFLGETQFDLASKQIYDSKGAAVWSNWIKPLKARRDGDGWIIEAPSAFHSSYVRGQFEAVFNRCFGRHAVHFA